MLPKFLQRFVPLLVCGVYALPAVMGLVADLGHGLDHFMTELTGRNGNVSGVVVHAHGGAPHAHGGSVNGLLLAAEQVDEEPSGQVLVAMAGHVPSEAPDVRVGPFGSLTSFASQAQRPRSDGLRPPLPPPRG